MKTTLFAVLVLLCVAFVTSERFDGSSVILVRINDESEFKKFATVFPIDSIDMWSEAYEANQDMEIRFTKEQVTKLGEMFAQKDNISFAKFQIMIEDVQKNIDAEKTQMVESSRVIEQQAKLLKTQTERDNFKYKDDQWFQSYHTYEENVAYYNKLASDYPTMVDKEVIGKSIEGRDIMVLRLHAPGQYDSSKPSLFIEANQHAREWVAQPTSQYFVKKLLSTFETNERAKAVLKGINVHWVPFVNPDGFVFTHTNNRMWRKNRRRNPRGSYGVDLNRNWKSGFGGAGSSGSESSDVYRGTGVFSEPETKAIDDYLTKYEGEMKGAIDYHAYSQLNLRPWGKIRTPSADEAALKSLGQKMMDALRAVHGQSYRNIRAAELYQAGGLASDDWYENHKLTAYTYELRPSSAFGGGFNLPARQILPCAEENYPATLVLAEHLISQSKKNNNSDELDQLLKNIK